MRLPNLERTVEDVLTAHVMDAGFQSAMLDVAKQRCFEGILYGGWIYDFGLFSRAIGGDFDSGVTTLRRMGHSGLLASMLSGLLRSDPDLRLIAHNYVSLDDPFPVLKSGDQSEVQNFLEMWPSMPLNLLVVRGESLDRGQNACVAIADICDGEAWLVAFKEQ